MFVEGKGVHCQYRNRRGAWRKIPFTMAETQNFEDEIADQQQRYISSKKPKDTEEGHVVRIANET